MSEKERPSQKGWGNSAAAFFGAVLLLTGFSTIFGGLMGIGTSAGTMIEDIGFSVGGRFLLIGVVLIIIGITLIGAGQKSKGPSSEVKGAGKGEDKEKNVSSPFDALKERFAEGEISEEEFKKKKEMLEE